MSPLEIEILLNSQILLVNSITDRMRYIFIELVSEKDFTVLVYYSKIPLEIDHELITDVCQNMLANIANLSSYHYEYRVDYNTSYGMIKKLKHSIFGRYESSNF
ncbi:MAG: hypothetical protein AAB221_02040 [Bacteroidota bacterium]